MIGQSAGKLRSLYYLMGVYLGDGWFGYIKANRSYLFRIDCIDADFAQATADALENILNKSITISYITKRPKNKKPIYSISVNCKELEDFFLKDSLRKQKIPDWVMETKDRNLIKEFAAGLLDSDGWMAKSKTKNSSIVYQLGVAGSNGWIIDFHKLLQVNGLKTGRINRMKSNSGRKKMLRFLINKWSFIENGFYFKIKRKQDRVNEFSKTRKHWHNNIPNPSETTRLTHNVKI